MRQGEMFHAEHLAGLSGGWTLGRVQSAYIIGGDAVFHEHFPQISREVFRVVR